MLAVESALQLVSFRREQHKTQPIFDLAGRGEVEAATRRLDLFALEVDRDWYDALLLTIAWLAFPLTTRSGPCPVRPRPQERVPVADPRAAPAARGRGPRRRPAPDVQLPSPPPQALAIALVERLGGAQGESFLQSEFQGSELGVELRSSTEELLGGRGYLAEHDGPQLVAAAVESPAFGEPLLRQYLAIHSAYGYRQYRQGSLWALLDAILRHPSGDWVRTWVPALGEAVLAPNRGEFAEGLQPGGPARAGTGRRRGVPRGARAAPGPVARRGRGAPVPGDEAGRRRHLGQPQATARGARRGLRPAAGRAGRRHGDPAAVRRPSGFGTASPASMPRPAWRSRRRSRSPGPTAPGRTSRWRPASTRRTTSRMRPSAPGPPPASTRCANGGGSRAPRSTPGRRRGGCSAIRSSADHSALHVVGESVRRAGAGRHDAPADAAPRGTEPAGPRGRVRATAGGLPAPECRIGLGAAPGAGRRGPRQRPRPGLPAADRRATGRAGARRRAPVGVRSGSRPSAPWCRWPPTSPTPCTRSWRASSSPGIRSTRTRSGPAVRRRGELHGAGDARGGACGSSHRRSFRSAERVPGRSTIRDASP